MACRWLQQRVTSGELEYVHNPTHFYLVQWPLDRTPWRGGRAVECGRLEICFRAT
jgi:hypothetical protein